VSAPAEVAALAAAWPGWAEGFHLGTLGRLVLGLALGGAVGLERELSGKPAGLRTNMLICAGAVLFTEMSIALAAEYAPHELIRSDPARIAAQIVSGVGFLGAGTILVARGHVVGLTTAATIWVVAAIGVAVGVGAYVIAVGTTVLVVVTLFLLGRVEQRVVSSRSEATLAVETSGEAGPDVVDPVIRESGFRGQLLAWEREEDGARLEYAVQGPEDARDELMRALAGVRRVRGARFTWGAGGGGDS
jgi:putative Mg2+ transporter-C (MgtC) family protein